MRVPVLAASATWLVLLSSPALSADRNPKTSAYTVGPSVQPMVIVGEGWSQKFTFINADYYDKEPTVGTLSFYTRDGRPWRVPIKDRGLVDHIDVTLLFGQMFTIETEVSTAAQTLGWANFKLSSNINQWGIYHAFTVYRKQTPGQPDLISSVGFVDGLEDEWVIPIDNTGGKYPGVALVNTSTFATTTFTFDVFNMDGTRIKTFTKSLAPMNLNWFSLVGDYPDLASAQGQMKVTGGFASTAVLTLQFTPNGAFAALPVVHTFGMK